MRANWNVKRKPEDFKIPEIYLEKSSEMQNRRELTFLLQEAAFAEKIPLFHILDYDLLKAEEKEIIARKMPNAQSVIFLGIPLHEPLLLMEQTIFGKDIEIKATMAEKKVESFLRSFNDKLEILGYKNSINLPDILIDEDSLRILEMTSSGFIGKNRKFIIEGYGSKNYIGYLITNAPLMGGDLRYSEYKENLCKDCNICIEKCPSNALSTEGFDREKCRIYREDKKNQTAIETKSYHKCDICFRCCPIGLKWDF